LETHLSRLAVELNEVQAQTERQREEVEARSVTVSHYAENVQQSTAFIKAAESELLRDSMSKFTASLDLQSCQSVTAVFPARLPALGEVANFSTVAAAHGFRVHPDGQRIAIANTDNIARVISVHTGRALSELSSHSDMCAA
jgi:hypothetical protein